MFNCHKMKTLLKIYLVVSWIMTTQTKWVLGTSTGDLRLVEVEEITSGLLQDDNMLVNYVCKTNLPRLEPSSRKTCATPSPEGHNTLEFETNHRTLRICPDGWIHYKGICYRYLTNSANWEGHRGNCQRLGADLARIPDREHSDFLTNIISYPAFILVNDRRKEGRYEFSPTEPVHYFNWNKGQPDNGGPFIWNNEDCVEIFPVNYHKKPGKWNDCPCKARMHGICSKEAGPYWTETVGCQGNENRLIDCPRSKLESKDCQNGQAVKISCSLSINKIDKESFLSTQLIYRGLLQIWQASKWRYVCDKDFKENDTQVACRQLRSIPHLMFEYLAQAAGCNNGSGLVQHKKGCSPEASTVRECGRVDGGFLCEDIRETVKCTVISKKCNADRYGENCSAVCGNCTKGRCSSTDGSCLEGGCKSGYMGPKCNKRCASGNWGSDCKHKCVKCDQGTCDPVNGKCSSKPLTSDMDGDKCVCPGGACADGYIGALCKSECLSGKWGPTCDRKCGACYGTCQPATGACLSGTCQSGYGGDRCDQVCTSGAWGRNCIHTCGMCSNGTCSVTDGKCPGGCLEGYTDSTCLQGPEVCNTDCPVCERCSEMEFIRGSRPSCQEDTWVFPALYTTSAFTALFCVLFCLQCFGIYNRRCLSRVQSIYTLRLSEGWQ